MPNFELNTKIAQEKGQFKTAEFMYQPRQILNRHPVETKYLETCAEFVNVDVEVTRVVGGVVSFLQL